jgi:histidinol-phosphatase
VSPDLSLALELADLADGISLSHFRTDDLLVETKPDLSPVTEADTAVERTIRERLAADRPGDGVLGEEYAVVPTLEGGRRWIVDPIDGTRNYSRGIPVWATLIALEKDGVLQVGVVSAPALGRRWWAENGAGAFANGQPIRGFGDFWAHMLVAEGAADGAVDAQGVRVWDLAAVRIVVEEAGGRFTDRAGVARIDGGSAISSNGLLHDELLG